MDWSLLGCGTGGHITFAPDHPGLRERLNVGTRDGTAWRCLRCGAFVLGEPTRSGPVSAAPEVRRGKELRSALILRFFAVERFIRAIIFAALAFGLWRFTYAKTSIEQAFHRELPLLQPLLHQLGVNVNHSKLIGLIQHAFTLTPRVLAYLAIGAAVYAVIEIIEGLGLWLLKRWGEYFAMIATCLGLPYEIYDLTAKVTALRVIAFAINLALVIYLVTAKRLFGVRGGKHAYEAQLRSASILGEEAAALAARPSPPAPARSGPGAQAGPGPVPASTQSPRHSAGAPAERRPTGE